MGIYTPCTSLFNYIFRSIVLIKLIHRFKQDNQWLWIYFIWEHRKDIIIRSKKELAKPRSEQIWEYFSSNKGKNLFNVFIAVIVELLRKFQVTEIYLEPIREVCNFNLLLIALVFPRRVQSSLASYSSPKSISFWKYLNFILILISIERLWFWNS